MSQWPEDYVKNVLEDVKKYNGIRTPLRASIIERLLVRNTSPRKMHPNPVDEFSWDSVGPNFGIVGKYEAQIRNNMGLSNPIFDEPIIVEKMGPDGYMLINGHHRWFAALRVGVKRVPIEIVNLTHEADIKSALAKSNNIKCAAFDLDEILLVEENGYRVEEPKAVLTSKMINERLRFGAPEVINALKAKGYDIWVYTASYRSAELIRKIFDVYELEVDGIVNGINRKKDKDEESAKTLLSGKYERQLHIDNESVLCTNTQDKTFEQFEFQPDNDNWAKNVIEALKGCP